MKKLLAIIVALSSVFAVCAPSPASADPDVAARATDLILAAEYDRARAELAKADPSSPSVVLAKARLALYEEDCDLAASLLSHKEAAGDDEGRLLADVSRGCARVTAATLQIKDENEGVWIRFQDEADRALAPLMVETASRARAALTRDLGVQWKKPTRITVVRDLLSLSAMTGLPYKSAQTTGTVAVAKWGRVTILSPRASHSGYTWRDTLAHEMTHLAISQQTHDRAPLWLHEGLARRGEYRWRAPAPFDDRPSPESVVMRGIDLKLDLALDKLGPSIAMLPSADAATVAFAEVTSFIKYLVETSGEQVLPKLLLSLRDAKTVDDALKQVTGETLAQWDVKWRKELPKRAKDPLSAMYGLGGTPPGMGDSRERARLAELLLGRGHPAEALVQLDKIPETMLGDPSLRYLRARVLERSGKTKEAEALVEDPKAWIASYGPCWAIRGRLLRARGEDAALSFAEAVAHDPLGVESACERDPADPPDPARKGTPLCDAAENRHDPDLGRD